MSDEQHGQHALDDTDYSRDFTWLGQPRTPMPIKLPLIYIAGPFRGPTPYAVRKNIEAARDIGLTVAYHGGYPIIPHTMTGDFDKQLTDEFWLEGTMEMLRRCDAILLGHRWNLSTGARAERDEAERLKLPIFYSNNLEWERQLADWVLAWKANR